MGRRLVSRGHQPRTVPSNPNTRLLKDSSMFTKLSEQELFPTRPPGNRIHDFIETLETTRF